MEDKTEVIGNTVEMKKVESELIKNSNNYNNNKKGNGSTIIIIILLLIIVGMGGFIAYKEIFSNNVTNSNHGSSNNATNTNATDGNATSANATSANATSANATNTNVVDSSTEYGELSVSDSLVKNLYRKIVYCMDDYDNKGIYSDNDDDYKDIFKAGNFYVSNMTDVERINLLAKVIMKSEDIDKISAADFEKKFHEFYGSNIAYNYNDVKVGEDLGTLKVTKNGDNITLWTSGCDLSSNTFKSKIVKAERDANGINIYVKVGFFTSFKDDTSFTIGFRGCKDSKCSTVVKTHFNADDADYSYDDMFNEIIDSLNTYKVIYKTNSDGTYSFYGVEKQ